jgi:hypothetical protein
MNEAIANIAKHCHFDAAHYTWIHLDRRKIVPAEMSTLENKMLAHGDYAAPLKTREVKQPFDNMAVVMGFDKVGDVDDSYLLFTFDCRDSMLYEAHMWGQRDITHTPVVTLHFKPKPEQFKGVPPASEEHNPLGKNQDGLVLVSMPPKLPQHMKDGIVKTIIPIMKMVALYIPCASEGLLQGEELEYYKPSNMGNNEKRKRKGKAGLYEWRTVTLERKRHGLPSAPKGGTHASPRLHQRRGHWATSKLGKRFWRAESVVGKAENGMIFHDYEDKKENQHARY